MLLVSATCISQNNEFTKPEDVNLIRQKLLDHARNTNTIESKFIQEKHLWMLNEVIISHGVFLFKKENSVRWQYDTPIDYTILIYNGIFTIVNNGNANDFDIDSNPLFQEINNMIVTAIRGDFLEMDDFGSELLQNDDYYLARLLPEDENVSSMLTSIDIYFSKNSLDVEKVIFYEPGDDFTSILFLDKKVNAEIPDTRFLIEQNEK